MTQPLVEIHHPLPSEDFYWRTPEEQIHLLYRAGEPTGIRIRGIHTGVYLVAVGDSDVVETPSLRYAQAVAHNLAWALRDKLPIPDRSAWEGTGRRCDPRWCDCDSPSTESGSC